MLPLVALALAAALLAPTAALAQVDLRYPPDHTVVHDPDLPVEGRVTRLDLDEVVVRVGDGREDYLRVRDTFFAGEVELEEGENTVRVEGVTAVVWYETDETPAPAGYRQAYGHFGLGDGCAECHEVDRDDRFALSADPAELCDWCHGDLVRGRRGKAWGSVHAPVEKGSCLTCHVAHISPSPGLPAEKAPECAACHGEVVERLSTDRFVHGPMHLGDCRLCHAVHASEQPALLVRPATSLCTDCHSDALPKEGTPEDLMPHRMIPEGRCGVCHEPHSSPNPKFLRQPAARLCLECHEGKTRSFHEAKGFSIYVCAKCHDLHRPFREHLLTDTSRSLCLQCHDYGGEAAFTHSFVRDGECFRCHAFHEAPLGRDVALTCLRCHRENPRLPEAHGGVPFSRSRCTSCHLPHQSQSDKLLRAVEHTPFAERECEACHTARAGLLEGETVQPLCVDCHDDKSLAALPEPPAAVHPPLRDGDCADCHESHDAESPGLLRRPPVKLCLECDRALRKAFLVTPAAAHPPFVEGRCAACHDPHFSGTANLLRSGPRELCFGCHAGLAAGPDGAPWPVAHPPVAEGKCRLCHRPHTASNPSLLRSPAPQPCRPCHAEFFSGLEARGAGRTHAPVREGRCGGCHALHGGEREALLRDGPAVVCSACHPAPQSGHHLFRPEDLEAKPGGAGARERACLHCHVPHASTERRLLLPRRSRVCAGCHAT